MSERITLVVPDGTRKRLKDKAETDGYTQSALGRKILLDGLKVNTQIKWVQTLDKNTDE